ncbi:MAG: hypothetical protein E6R03_13460 [Hyphomicrobiaceae bacterium]|nr:MAG: hypothetical protein E6R03_13460 [Hyphomicrobiaceae bacterium]
MTSGWNPRFVAYAKTLGRTPEEQLSYQNGSMIDFMLWISERKLAAEKAGHPCVSRCWSELKVTDQKLWDEWLQVEK